MILALDLSTPRGALAVVDLGGRSVFGAHFRAHRSHNALVFPHLERALAACGQGGPSEVVIGTGPGSYTGIRVAIAAGTGIAMSYGVPLLGLPSALAAEREEDAAPYLFVGDARRGTYFGAEVDPGCAGGRFEVEMFDLAGFMEWMEARSGRVAWTFDPKVAEVAGGAVRLTYPDAERLGRVLAGGDRSEKRKQKLGPLEPIYLSAPFVTMPKTA